MKTKLIFFFLCFVLAKSNIIGPKDAASITVASNSESIVEYLETVYERSKVKFNAKAYLHWYNKYGTTNVSTCINILDCRRNVRCLPRRQSGQLFHPGFSETKVLVALSVFVSRYFFINSFYSIFTQKELPCSLNLPIQGLIFNILFQAR